MLLSSQIENATKENLERKSRHERRRKVVPTEQEMAFVLSDIGDWGIYTRRVCQELPHA